MKVLFGFILLYLWLPFVGLFNFSQHQINLYGDIDNYIKVSNFIHIVIVLSVCCFIAFWKVRQVEFQPESFYSDFKVKWLYTQSMGIILFCICVMLIFGAGAVLNGEIGRGELRANLGPFGFFYNFVTMFLPAGIISLCSAIYLLSTRSRFLRNRLILVYIMTISVGMLTGFKYTALLISSAGLIQLSPVLKFRYLVFVGTCFFGLMLVSASYFMSLDMDVALSYLLARATSVSSEGTVAVWNIFPYGGDDAWMALLYAFGNKLSSLLTGYPVNSVDFLQINITRLMGYLTYPKPEEALSGAFNLTVTNFGEGVYYFGRYFYFVFSLITGTVLGVAVRYLRKSFSTDSLITNTMLLTYISIVMLPWLMGGAIGNLFGIPTIVYMSLLYFFLKFVFFSKIRF
ncbi:hypothetical protein [Vibrio sp. SBT000027]|uniref:hypothetical protein n=1 Tax=Vibrio sp. SBT000027 TaxID=1803384 RepID=UPI000EF4ABA7|nr:hypothetical protein [Vibrio sp. SBT000027]RLQ15604.1 hypothetical protein AYK60_10315 [Vibrio sp. SBT000027]